MSGYLSKKGVYISATDIGTESSPTYTGLTLSGSTASTLAYLNASKKFTSLANGAGYLLNDGSGGLSWGAVSFAGYLKADASVPLTADWNVGAFSLTMKNLMLNNGTATGVIALPDGSIVYGGECLTPIGSLTGVSIGVIGTHTTQLLKTAHGINFFQGDLVAITSCTTEANRGVYTYIGEEGLEPDEININHVLTGADTDIALTVYRNTQSIDAKGKRRTMTTVHEQNDIADYIAYEVDLPPAATRSRGLVLFFGSHTDNWGTSVTNHRPFEIYRNWDHGTDFFYVNADGLTYSQEGFYTETSYRVGTDIYLSRGATRTLQLSPDAAAPLWTGIKAASGVGTDKSGGSITFSGGNSTGTGEPGQVYFNVCEKGTASGSSANSGFTRGILDEFGLTFGTSGKIDPRQFGIRWAANAVVQPGAIVMVDSGTDNRFDVNTAGGTLPIGVMLSTTPSVQSTFYYIAVQGITWVIPAEDVVAVTRGHVLYVDPVNAGCVNDAAALQAAGLNVGRATRSEAAITFDAAVDVDPVANTIILDSAPGWAVNDPVIYWATGDTPPTGMVTGTVYWIKTITSATITLSATRGGAVLDITEDGSGTSNYLMRLPLCILHWQ